MTTTTTPTDPTRRLPVWETYDRIRDYERPETPCAIDLGDNTNLWGSPPAVRAALASLRDEDLTRYPSVYSQALVTALARQNEVAPEWVVSGCGSDDLLDSTLRALVRPGSTLGFQEPTFTMVPTFGWMNGLEAAALPSIEEVEAAPADRTPEIVYLCRPNNPTGECLPAAEVERWLRLPRAPWVLLDEAYVDFGADSLVSWVPSYPNLVIFRTLSKLYGLAGARVGYCIAQPAVATEIRKSRGPYKVSRIAERLALAAVEDGSSWAERIRNEVHANRQRLLDELTLMGWKPRPSRSNFVLLPLPDGFGAGETAERTEQLGVRLRPFTGLSGLGEAVRITIGPWEQMERALQVLRQVLRAGESQKAARPRIAILDYGAGNLRSISRGLEASGAEVVIEASVAAATAADGLVLPGVGSFAAASRYFDAEPGSRETLRDALSNGLPCLGICLGMQFLFEGSAESQGAGVGWFPGAVRPLETETVPNMGWSEVAWSSGTPETPTYYFAHGFHCVPTGDGVLAETEVDGRKVVAAFSRGRTLGVQFHPEKSGEDGLELLRSFVAEVAS